jgi:CRP/FNR family cyclic AMP-dependent transcriptional regulator
MKLPDHFSNPSHFRDYPAGSSIFTAGQPGDEMFIVQSGEVDIVIAGTVVETVGPDHFFGEMAVIDEAPRSATAVARTNCQLLPLNQRRFTFLVDEMPFFAIKVMKVMADRLRRAAASQAKEGEPDAKTD